MSDETPRTVRRLSDGAVERVAVTEVGRGDRLLVRPGESVGVDARITEILDDSPATVDATDGTRRAAEVGTGVAAGERIRGSVVVVTCRERAAVPPVGARASSAIRTVALAVVVVAAVTATGFGLWNPLDSLVTGDQMDANAGTDATTNEDGITVPSAPNTPTGGSEQSGESGEESSTSTDGGDETPTDTPTPSDSSTTLVAASEDDGSDGGGSVDLRVGGGTDATLFAATGVLPGGTGSGSGTVANDGDGDGTLRIEGVTYTSRENGRNGAEAAVDDTGGNPGVGAGELHEAVELRVAVDRPGEARRYVVGDADTYRGLTDIAGTSVELGSLASGEELSLVVEWRVDSAAGNEIQSDGVDVTVSLRLTG